VSKHERRQDEVARDEAVMSFVDGEENWPPAAFASPGAPEVEGAEFDPALDTEAPGPRVVRRRRSKPRLNGDGG
jgi:hypothetical protein